jgi:hypothetical protein
MTAVFDCTLLKTGHRSASDMLRADWEMLACQGQRYGNRARLTRNRRSRCLSKNPAEFEKLTPII